MQTINKAPKAGAKSFPLSVFPSRDCMLTAIAAGGRCHPKKCWHYVAISALMAQLDPGEKHRVRVDAGHIKLNYKGWRYIADTPKHVKHSLMLFDRGRYDAVYVKRYILHFRRTTKIMPMTAERQAKQNEARKARVAAGGNEYQRNYDLRKRVEGFSGIV